MLVEDFMHEIEDPLLALEFLNNTMDDEIRFKYGDIKNGDKNNVLGKILSLLCANKTVIKLLREYREELRNTIHQNYNKLLKEEI